MNLMVITHLVLALGYSIMFALHLMNKVKLSKFSISLMFIVIIVSMVHGAYQKHNMNEIETRIGDIKDKTEILLERANKLSEEQESIIKIID